MAEYVLHCFAQSGNAYKVALMLQLSDWADYPHVAAWLARIQHLPAWVHPYKLMPGHPLPSA